MIVDNNKILVHFHTSCVSFYCLSENGLELLNIYGTDFSEYSASKSLLDKIDSILEKLNEICDNVSNKNVRVFATGIFQQFDYTEREVLSVHVFVFHGLCFNFIDTDLEKFYLSIGENDFVKGLVTQEYRNVVVCGSFQQHLPEISKVIELLNRHNVKVLSPWTTKVIPSTIGTDFILLEGQAPLRNERDTWYHKYEHMKKFRKSDAIIVCNPGGEIGQGTMFEFGFMIAYQKRIILLQEPKNISIKFPYEIELDYK